LLYRKTFFMEWNFAVWKSEKKVRNSILTNAGNTFRSKINFHALFLNWNCSMAFDFQSLLLQRSRWIFPCGIEFERILGGKYYCIRKFNNLLKIMPNNTKASFKSEMIRFLVNLIQILPNPTKTANKLNKN